jgi:C-terminal binding protein
MSGDKLKVVITDFIHDELKVERDVLGGIADVIALNALHESDLNGKIEDADAIMLYHNLGLTAKTIGRLEKCKLIVRCGVGFDNVDRECASQNGIPVVNVPDYGTEEVADSAIGMTLALTRGINYFNVRLQDPNEPWTYEAVAPLYRLRGRVFGIIGLGRIGIATAQRALALGMDVRFYDPLIADGFDKAIGITRVESLEELMRESYVLSVHCPLTPQTRHLINHQSLNWMPAGSYLVNTARGDVVDTTIIPDAIASGKLAGAAIDVLACEPPKDNNPLLVAWRDPSHPAHQRVIVNPHSAFYCEEGLEDMRRKGAQACQRAFTGERLRNQVN